MYHASSGGVSVLVSQSIGICETLLYAYFSGMVA